MSSFEDMVIEFHKAVGQPARRTPTVQVGQDAMMLRLNMLIAEFAELMGAMAGFAPDSDRVKSVKLWLKRDLVSVFNGGVLDLENMARQITDMHYVLTGTSVAFGLPEKALFDEVHRANMLKVGGPVRPDGKQLPPEGWQPPDILGVLSAYGWDPIELEAK